MTESARSLLLLAVGLMFGVALGWAMAPRRTHFETHATAAASLTGSANAQDQAFDLRPPSSPESSAGLGIAESASRNMDAERLVSNARKAIDQPTARLSAPIAGQGRIFGRVTSYDGQPLAKVELELEPGEGRDLVAAPVNQVGRLAEPKSVEERVLEAARKWSMSDRERRRALSSEDGSFSFEGLPDGSWSLEAALPHWSLERVADKPKFVPTGSQVDFRALPCSSLEIVVLDASGAQLESATLEVSSDRGAMAHYAWSAKQPVLELGPGSYRMRAISEPRPWSVEGDKWLSDLASAELELTLEPGIAPLPVTLMFEPRGGIVGRLLLPPQKLPGEWPRVLLLPSNADHQPTADEFRTELTQQWVQNEAEFAFLDLAPGHYAVGLVTDWNSGAIAFQKVEVTRGLTEVLLEVTLPDTPRALRVRARTSDGRALRDLHLLAKRKCEHDSTVNSVDTRCDALGVYEVLGEEFGSAYWTGGESGCTYVLSIGSASCGAQQVEVEPGQEQLEVTFDEPAEIELTLVGWRPGALTGRTVIQVLEAGEVDYDGVWNWEQEQPDGDGRLTLRSTPGPKQIVLSALLEDIVNDSWSHREMGRRDVVLQSGVNLVSMPFSQFYELRVHAPNLDPGTRLILKSIALGETNWSVLDQERRMSFGNLVEGEYVLSGPSGLQQELSVPGPEVLFQPRQARGQRLEGLEESHALYGAGLRAGDVLLQIDGTAVLNGNLWSYLYPLVTGERESCAVLLERDGVATSIEIRGTGLSAAALRKGFSFAPVFD